MKKYSRQRIPGFDTLGAYAEHLRQQKIEKESRERLIRLLRVIAWMIIFELNNEMHS